MKRFLLGIVEVFAVAALPLPAGAQQAVILVRHADRDDKKEDSLTQPGHLRAKALARTLKDAGITVIVRCDTHRARDTAGPTAELLKLRGTPNEKAIKYDKGHVENALKAIRDSKKDAVVLYIGHADTVEELRANWAIKARSR
jgi:phosphohistidine phosphatase SixA